MITLTIPNGCPEAVVTGYFNRACRWQPGDDTHVECKITRDFGFEPDYIATIKTDGELRIVIGAHFNATDETYSFHS